MLILYRTCFLELLLFSILALLLGPLILRLASRGSAYLSLLDGATMVLVVGFVLVHIMPRAFQVAGFPVVLIAIAGLLVPGWLERSLKRVASRTHALTLTVATVGLVAHALFDGVALGLPNTDHSGETSMLALAVVFHRLPIAITLWWLVRPSGLRAAISILFAVGAATLIGYFLATDFSAMLNAEWLAYAHALVAGSLLHVLFHRPLPKTTNTDSQDTFWSGVGALLALGVVLYTADAHPHFAHEASFASSFLALCLATAPALLLGLSLAGLLQVVFPSTPLSWMRSGSAPGDAVRGMVFGLPLPICSCGVIPLYRTLIKRGVPSAAAMAFLVATPELGLDAILISIPLLGGELTLARVISAALVALLVGAFVGAWAEKRTVRSSTEAEDAQPPPNSMAKRLLFGLRYGLVEVVDSVGPWLVLGLAIAAMVEPVLNLSGLQALPSGLDVLLFALLGLPTYVCASGATPLAAALILKGISPGAALAFLLAGPATNATTFGVLSKLHNRTVAFGFGFAVVLLSMVLGLVVNAIVATNGGLNSVPHHHDDYGVIAWGSLAILTVAFGLSLLRIGPRGFISHILTAHDEGESNDDHDHCCH